MRTRTTAASAAASASAPTWSPAPARARRCPRTAAPTLALLLPGLALLFAGAAPAAAQAEWVEYRYAANSDHPYRPNLSAKNPGFPPVEINIPGAVQYRVKFRRIQVEDSYDFVDIYAIDPSGRRTLAQSVTGNYEKYVTPPITAASLLIILRSDESTEGYGYDLDGFLARMSGAGEEYEEPPPDTWPPPGTPPSRPPSPPAQPPAQPPVFVEPQYLTRVEVFEAEGRPLAVHYTLLVGEDFHFVVQGYDQRGRPMPVAPEIRFAPTPLGRVTVDSAGVFHLTLAGLAGNHATLDVHFHQNHRWNRHVDIDVRPRLDFSYRDSGRKFYVDGFGGVNRGNVTAWNLWQSGDPNVLRGENINAGVKDRRDFAGNLFLEHDHAIPLVRGTNYITLEVTDRSGTTYTITYQLEYRRESAVPLR